ncbi:MAG: SDR family NAD(P)-dependent oxidoreductase [Bacteroidota bacterium]
MVILGALIWYNIVSGKNAIIVGSLHKIGAEFAKMIAEDGINMILVDWESGRLEKLKRELTEQYHHLTIKTIVEDLDKPFTSDNIEDALWLYQSLGAAPREFDLIVNVLNFDQQLEDSLDDPWDETNAMAAELNIFSLMSLNKVLSKSLVRGKSGEILNIISGRPSDSNWQQQMYQETKGLLMEFSDRFNQKLQPHAVTVHALSYSDAEIIFQSPDVIAPEPSQANGSHAMTYVHSLLSQMHG